MRKPLIVSALMLMYVYNAGSGSFCCLTRCSILTTASLSTLQGESVY